MKKSKSYPKKNMKFAVIAVDVVGFAIKENQLHILLIKNKNKPFEGLWALPGGLVQTKESLDEAVWRHLKNKTGLKEAYVEQLYSFGSIDRDPLGRVVSVAHLALVNNIKLKTELKTTDNYSAIGWFAVDKLPKTAYDHKEIIKCALERLRGKLSYTNIVYGLLPKKFTLGEMQAVYEIILSKKLDKRNFRKKILGLKILCKTGELRTGGTNRPAVLYEFVSRKSKVVEVL